MIFRFITKHACDGQMDRRTDRQNYDPQDRASIAASRGEKRNDHRSNQYQSSHQVQLCQGASVQFSPILHLQC